MSNIKKILAKCCFDLAAKYMDASMVLFIGKFCYGTLEKRVIGQNTPPHREFAQRHRKFVVFSRHTVPIILIISHISREREGVGNVQTTIIFNLRFLTNIFRNSSPSPFLLG
jgi:hypothetical protein